MESVRKVLSEVMAGRPIGLGLYEKAQSEVVRAEAVLATNTIPGPDEVLRTAGELFMILEDLLVEARKLELFDGVRPDVAETLIKASVLLRQLNYGPIKGRKREPITFSGLHPVVPAPPTPRTA